MLFLTITHAFTSPFIFRYSKLFLYDQFIRSNTSSKLKLYQPTPFHRRVHEVLFSTIDVTPPEDEGEQEEDSNDPYAQLAESEFGEDKTAVDWGGALGKLRERISDLKKGRSQMPSNALFRVMTRDSPNETIINFLQEAKPDVVSAMTGAVMSLLGGLSNPAIGVETIVKADGEKLGNLCFQLQMTGYMFRNAEYVLALKDLMNLEVNAELSQYKEAFDKLDKDGSGYIEASEIESLLTDVYDGVPPKFEVDQFIKFFDVNRDGRVSWEEFKVGLNGNAKQIWNKFSQSMTQLKLPSGNEEREEDEDDVDNLFLGVTEVHGIIKVELEDGNVIEVEAKEYIKALKDEANALKEALRQEIIKEDYRFSEGKSSEAHPRQSGSLGTYISSLPEKHVKKLTEGISPEVIDAMKMLVDYVLESPQSKAGKKRVEKGQEMEISGSALQQLALWQLVLGYRLREQEATGEWRRIMDQ